MERSPACGDRGAAVQAAVGAVHDLVEDKGDGHAVTGEICPASHGRDRQKLGLPGVQQLDEVIFFLLHPLVAAAAAGAVADRDLLLCNREKQTACTIAESTLYIFVLRVSCICHGSRFGSRREGVGEIICKLAASAMLQRHCVGGGIHFVKIGKSLVTSALRIEICIDRAAGGDLNVLVAVSHLLDLDLHKIRKAGRRAFPVVRIQVRNTDCYRARSRTSYLSVIPA